MPYANIGDCKIYFEIYGNELELAESSAHERPTIIVMHGGFGIVDHTLEVDFWQRCAAFAQVIFIDHRGGGRSIDNNPANWNLKQWTKDIHSFCEALSLKKPFIQGVSMGGWLAQLFAIQYPDYAGGIILLETEAYVDLERICAAFEKRGGKRASELARQFFQKELPPPEVLSEYFEKCIPLCSINPIPPALLKYSIPNPKLGVHAQVERATFNCKNDLHKIKVPVLYLTNTINPSHLYEVAKETANAMINAEVTFVPFDNCGIVQFDTPEPALAEIKKFVKKYHHV